MNCILTCIIGGLNVTSRVIGGYSLQYQMLPPKKILKILWVVFTRADTNIRNATNEPFSKRTNIRIFVRFDD